MTFVPRLFVCLVLAAGTLSCASGAGEPVVAPSPSAPCQPGRIVALPSGDTGRFDRDCISASAGTAFTVTLDNQHPGVLHNVAVFRSEQHGTVGVPLPSAGSVFDGTEVRGIATITYNVPALSAGTYQFYCLRHWYRMHGELHVG